MNETITVIILTYNEELHIKRCIQSLKNEVDQIIVIDSFSTDKTVDIAKAEGAEMYQNEFVNQAVQFNWGLKHCNITSEWVIRVDADEYLSLKSGVSLKDYITEIDPEIKGFLIQRKIVFLDREILHGGWFPKWNLRLFKYGFGECENKWMDEHIVLSEGDVQSSDIILVDENLNDLDWWSRKHLGYASREAADYFLKNDSIEVQPIFFGNDTERKRWLKNRYLNTPLFIRPFINYVYRYFFKLGFLDGKQGLVWHFLQGFWYRFLVDAKILELKLRFKNDKQLIVNHLKEKYTLNK